MFTGIIEEVGKVVKIEKDQQNYHFTIQSSFANKVKIDQSIAHNGACLTVVKHDENSYVVTAIDETMQKTNLDSLEEGSKINLERCVKVGDHLDGHIVQGHVDKTAECIKIQDENGSWKYTFKYKGDEVTVPKGSITVNGVSLTVVDSEPNLFSVAIIPYTQEHTNFHTFEIGTIVNIEFDVIGKYVQRMLSAYAK